MDFVGRRDQLARLDRALDEVRRGGAGLLLSIRGRRQIGKSRLVEEFLTRSRSPAVFHTATRQPGELELEAFREALALSGTSAASAAAGAPFGSWRDALTLVAALADEPTVLVLDEFPSLVESDPTVEAVLQAAWDRQLSRKAILLILIGSDVSVMEALSSYGRPLYGRAQELVVPPLTPSEVAELLGLADPAAALDAYLVIGGYPRLAAVWRRRSLWTFLRDQLRDPSSPLIVTGERSVNAEFPPDAHARAVLHAIGAGERAFGAIAGRAGIAGTSLERALALLQRKRVLEKAHPYSAAPARKSPRYTVADPYLRFWLRFIAPAIPLVERGRGDVALESIRSSWPAYRGRAIEPVVRASIERLLPHEALGEARFVGSCWTRGGDVQVDLVGGREPDRADPVDFVGSVKWREDAPFDGSDTRELAVLRARVPGATSRTRLVGVSRSGFRDAGLDLELSPEDLLAAWA